MEKIKFEIPDVLKEKPKFSEKLREIIVYFTFSVKYLSLIRLVKLIYMGELYYADRFNKRLSDANFYRWDYGPWSPDINVTAEIIAGNQILMEERKTNKGYSGSFFKPNIKELDINLSHGEKSILKKINSDWQYIPTKALTICCKLTMPFQKSPEKDIIKFEDYLGMKKTKVMGFEVIMNREKEGGYSTICPMLKGCFSQGETVEEATENTRDAIIAYIEARSKFKKV